MKSKYYPLVTVVGASIVAGLPVLILWSSLGSEEDAALSVTSEQPARAPITTPEIPAAPAIAPALSPRIAMSSAPAVNLPVTPAVESPQVPPVRLPEPAMSPELVQDSVPDPVDLATDLRPVIAESPAEPASSEFESLPEPPQTPVRSDSYYDATGHLALSSQPLVPDPAAVNSATAPTTSPAEQASVTKPSERRRTRKQKTEEVPAAESNLQNPASASEESPLPEGPIEDVAIQTPLETQSVGRVEDVVALTRARGWPVALIKSDLPDDVWWVQQMVGIQGTSFAARVNFGNEHSISGTRYHMVIVFLDSPDEVRRFRIAKQFKDIPAGVRRSREFLYIRN